MDRADHSRSSALLPSPLPWYHTDFHILATCYNPIKFPGHMLPKHQLHFFLTS